MLRELGAGAPILSCSWGVMGGFSEELSEKLNPDVQACGMLAWEWGREGAKVAEYEPREAGFKRGEGTRPAGLLQHLGHNIYNHFCSVRKFSSSVGPVLHRGNIQ